MTSIDRAAVLMPVTRILLFCTLALAPVCSATAQSTEIVPFQIRRGGSYLGLGLADVNPDTAQKLKLNEVTGVLIVAVERGAAGDLGGIRQGDVVLSFNGEKVLGAQQLIRLVSETPQGRHVKLLCWRDGAEKNIIVTTGAPHSEVSRSIGDPVSPNRITDIPFPVMLWRNLVLGVESESISDQMAESVGVKQGILVWNVAEGSPAQRAGLKAGDVVIGFCGHSIHSPRDLGSTLQQLQIGEKPISINLIRDHKPVLLTIPLDPDH
jgi:serine protease Do